MTEPTDTEAWEMWLSQPLTGHAPKSVGNFARAVLAKWGQPQAIASGEPVAAAVFDELLGRPVLVEGAPMLEHGQVLYTASPTQAVREPQPMPDLTQLTERGAVAWAGVDAHGLREGGADMSTQQTAPSEATEEVENLRKALVYVAFALHDTPQYMLAQGITLIDGDTVRVSRDGWTVEASVNPQRQPAPATQQAASSAVLKAIREANMQLVRTGDDAFMLVPYKVATAQAAESVPAPVADYPPLPSRYYVMGNKSVWSLEQMRAYVDADRAARAPEDSVTAPAATPAAASIAWNALRDATDPLGETGTRIMGLVRVFAQRQYEAGLAEGRATQPAQAQAGAVPLTPEKIAEIADAAHREYDRLVASGQCAPRWSAVFAHFLEQHHGIGIKGGQHGSNT